MKFHPLTFLILCITMLMVAGDLSAQEKSKDANKGKEVQTDKKAAEKKEAVKKDAPKQDALKQNAPKASKQEPAAKQEETTCVLVDLKMKDIGGNDVSLKKYDGKVVLIVNVASKCGFTGQYKPLQALHQQYNQHGLEVIAFPCNQFGKQEPHDEPVINEFCKKKFGIEFDVFSKVDVKGEGQVELFKRLTCCELKPAGKGPVRWNFEKFIIGKDGKPFARFRSNISPDDEKIVSKIKAALGIKDDKKEKAEPPKKEAGTVQPDVEKKTTPKDKQDKKP